MLEPKSLIQIITEEEFLNLAQEPCNRFFEFFNSFVVCLSSGVDISRKFYADLNQEAEYLETFLDSYGARENKRWIFFSEYVASIRNLGLGAFFIRHLMDRYPFYNLRDEEDTQKEFYKQAQAALDFINDSIRRLYQEIILAGEANGLKVAKSGDCIQKDSDIESNKRLPKNISQDDVTNEEDIIIALCEKVKMTARMMKDAAIKRTDDVSELKKLIPAKLNEQRARLFVNHVHTVQSEFDTYVKNTRIEQENPDLKLLRGAVSMSLHLLETVLWLCHFYERHEDEIRIDESKKKIALMVDKNQLFAHIINFAYHFGNHFISESSKIADELLLTFVKTIQVEVSVPQPLGFHARPSTYISLIARQYDEDLFLIIDGEKINAHSVMSLLQAGGLIADKGYQTVTFEGSKRMIEDIKTLARNNYCEKGEIPRSLSYLSAARK